MSGWEVILCSHSAKNSWKFFPTLHKYDKAVILLTVSADKPDTAFYHQRNCLAGILKSQRNTALESSEIAQGQGKRTKTVWSLSQLDERPDHKKHPACALSPEAHTQPPAWNASHRSLTFSTSCMELVIFYSKPAPYTWPYNQSIDTYILLPKYPLSLFISLHLYCHQPSPVHQYVHSYRCHTTNQCFFPYTWLVIFKSAVCLAAQSYPTLCDPMVCSPPGSSVHGISQARILEWVAISFSRGSF